MALILVIDDSETIRRQIKSLLETAGHQVVEGVDGIDGLEKAKSVPDIKLILCDVNMPRLDGLSMCIKLKEEALPNPVPIFMLTTESSPEMKTKGKDAGVLAWITKPFADAKLLSAVEKILSRPNA